MSSVQSALAKQPARQFTTAAPFQNDIFSYSVSTNPTTLQTTGVLTALASATVTASTCPAGRILRESGLKLYPGVNANVTTFMVGVVDTVTLLAGYIDPNSPIYAVYSTQLPFSPSYAAYPNNTLNGVDPGPGGLPDEGPPVYTNGNIICVSGNILTQTGSITSATYIRATTDISAGNAVQAGTSITSLLGNITALSGEVIATTGLGYSYTVYGGNVTQGTNKSTTVILNAPTGTITMNGALLNAQNGVVFTFTNSFIGGNDMLLLAHTSVGAIGGYTLNAVCSAGSAAITVRNVTTSNLSEAIVIQFMVFRA
uniref:Uncharacterized protein n=1 Tax=viral metagenome TaxID=1070528 RepID=A0A6C0K5I0_9ZZZZ